MAESVSHIIARRYASALFHLAKDDGMPEDCKKELSVWCKVLDSNPELLFLLKNNGIELPKRFAVAGKIVALLSSSKTVSNFILLLIKRGRLYLLKNIFSEYESILDAYKHMSRVEVRTSDALLAGELQDKLKKIISGILNMETETHLTEDKSLIGGFTLKINDICLDMSMAGKLKKLEAELL